MRNGIAALTHSDSAVSPPPMTVAQGAVRYLADCETRNLARNTVSAYRKIIEKFTTFCAGEGLSTLDSLTAEVFMRFRTVRTGRNPENPAKPSTLRKELACLRSFCACAVECGWMERNVAKKVKPPLGSSPPTLPFEQRELHKILQACEQLGNREHERTYQARRNARAFVLLLLYSGLRISDAAGLEKARLNRRTGHLMLRQMKTGIPVHVKLPEFLVDELFALSNPGPYFFWSGNGALISKIMSLRRTIAAVLKKAGIKGHPHRFRDTFSVELLKHDVPIRTVQLLLGHSTVHTTEQHYAPFVKSQQRILDAAVKKTWSQEQAPIKPRSMRSRTPHPRPATDVHSTPKQIADLRRGPGTDFHLTTEQIAQLWGLTSDTVRSLFVNEPDVLKVGPPGGPITMHVPQRVIERVHRQLANAASPSPLPCIKAIGAA